MINFFMDRVNAVSSIFPVVLPDGGSIGLERKAGVR